MEKKILRNITNLLISLPLWGGLGWGVVSCSGKQEADTHALVRQTAEQHYRHLVQGDIDGYLHAIHDYDALPPTYQQELHDAVADHLGREQRRHGGLQSVTATRDSLLPNGEAYVFLDVLYADNTQEQISLTLVEHEGRWMLK